MEIIKKRDAISWFRWSLLIVIFHALVIGLLHDWNFFSWYTVKVRFLSQEIIFETPRILEVIILPFIFLLWKIFIKEEREYSKLLFVSFGFMLALVFHSRIDTGIGLGTISLMFLGMYAFLCILAGVFLICLAALFFKFLVLLLPPIKKRYSQLINWLDAKEVC